jgi:predicted esterase
MDTIRKLAHYRGGCVIFMDYSRFSASDYIVLTKRYESLARLLQRKIMQATRNYKNVFLYGFSFGARLCFEAGAGIGYQAIDEIHACDPAGPGFDIAPQKLDPKHSAKHVHCINTSIDKGTSVYNCHINFRMGMCGLRQIGATQKPYGSHGLCVGKQFE